MRSNAKLRAAQLGLVLVLGLAAPPSRADVVGGLVIDAAHPILNGAVRPDDGSLDRRANVSVRIVGDAFVMTVTTGPDGRFVVRTLTPGSYRLETQGGHLDALAASSEVRLPVLDIRREPDDDGPVTRPWRTYQDLLRAADAATDTTTTPPQPRRPPPASPLRRASVPRARHPFIDPTSTTTGIRFDGDMLEGLP